MNAFPPTRTARLRFIEASRTTAIVLAARSSPEGRPTVTPTTPIHFSAAVCAHVLRGALFLERHVPAHSIHELADHAKTKHVGLTRHGDQERAAVPVLPREVPGGSRRFISI